MKNKLILSLLILILAMSGCKKYKNNQSSVTFWWTKDVWPGLYYNVGGGGSDQIKLYIDGDLVKVIETFQVYWLQEPNCVNEGILKYNIKMGKDKTATKSYKFVGRDEFVIWEGIINFKANDCLTIKLTL